jgi:Flp pilus assembly protein TadD
MLSQLDQLEGHWDQSRTELVEAHRVDPLVPRFHERLGLIEFQLHRTSEAIRELERATRESPSASTWSLLAQVQMAAGNADAARRAARKAIALDPGVNVGAVGGTSAP